jgi:hypothetical protein
MAVVWAHPWPGIASNSVQVFLRNFPRLPYRWHAILKVLLAGDR